MTPSDIVRSVIVNHVAVDMAVFPDRLWADIAKSFGGYDVWTAAGYKVDEIDDPTALLAYRMTLEKDGAIADQRVVRVTEKDEGARRISLFADFLSQPHGLLVFASYQAHEIAGGARYTIDCHSRMGIEPGAGTVVAKIAELQKSFDTYLNDSLHKLKAKLEAEQAAS